MSVLYFLQSIRFPVGEKLAQLITYLGEESAFIIIGMVAMWCFSRKHGFRFLFIGLNGTFINQLLKALFVTPRPWLYARDGYTIVESAREGASGYSFPSGHTQSSTMTFAWLATVLKKTWMKVVCVVLFVLVGFSRMYLGVHTPQDVAVGLVLGLLTVFVLNRAFDAAENTKYGIRVIEIVSFLISLGTVLYVQFCPKDGAAHVAQFDADGISSCWKLFGAALGLLLSYDLTNRYLPYETKAVWWAQILKTVLGLVLLLGVKEGLKPLTRLVFGEAAYGDSIRYFAVAVFGAYVWPLTFRFWSKLGTVKE